MQLIFLFHFWTLNFIYSARTDCGHRTGIDWCDRCHEILYFMAKMRIFMSDKFVGDKLANISNRNESEAPHWDLAVMDCAVVVKFSLFII